jgi:hypothetical protein
VIIRNGLRSIIFDLLPDEPPGITYDQLAEALEAIDISRDYRTLQKAVHLLRCDNQLRDSGGKPKRFWRGPTIAAPRPYYRSDPRPDWSRVGDWLLQECRLGREEIRKALGK